MDTRPFPEHPRLDYGFYIAQRYAHGIEISIWIRRLLEDEEGGRDNLVDFRCIVAQSHTFWEQCKKYTQVAFSQNMHNALS
jgi:hypothetical protein